MYGSTSDLENVADEAQASRVQQGIRVKSESLPPRSGYLYVIRCF